MPSIRVNTTVAAGGQNANVIQGNQFEFLRGPANVKVFARQSSAGTPGVGEVEVFLSQELVYPQGPVTIAAAGVRMNEDLIVDTFGVQGDRIVVREVETGGTNAAVIDVLVVITEVA